MPQTIRAQNRTRCGLCRSGPPKHPLFYAEAGGIRVPESIRETQLCDDCRDVVAASFTEAQLCNLQSLKPLREHEWVSRWLMVRSVRRNMTSLEFFEEMRGKKN